MENKYEFEIIAIDCFPSKMISEPAKVMITIVKSCKPTITGNRQLIMVDY
jgi:hypothetical protein